MARFQRGSLRQEERSAGMTWVLRFYRTREADGKRVEHTAAVGLVAKIGSSESAAWAEVERLHLHKAVNERKPVGAPTFGDLAGSYLTHELPRLAATTAYTTQHNLRKFLLPRWSKAVAVDIAPLHIEAWFKLLLKDGFANGTISKLRATMLQVYKHGQRIGLIPRTDEGNPVKFARASSKTTYRAVLISPSQAFTIINYLDQPERTLAFLSAATGLRISESLGLRWEDIDFGAQRIHVRRTWIQGKIGPPKTEASAAPVPLHPLLAAALREWWGETVYGGNSDWVFASTKLKGKQPREGNMVAADYLRPAAVRAGVIAADYRGRLGWHNFRHSLASFLVGSGTDAKTVQELLRHSKVQTTLDLYSQSMPAGRLAAQGQMLEAIFGQNPRGKRAGAPNV